MKILVTALIFYLFVFPFSDAKAERVPNYIIKKCQKAVLNSNPVKITYNYGTLSLDLSKNDETIKKACRNDDVAGCFSAVRKSFFPDITPQNIKINEYTCRYVNVDIDFDFTGTVIYVSNEYNGCNARVILRHELQHFMFWKTARENMLHELKNKLTTFVAQSAIVCRNTSYNHCNYDTSKITAFINNIVQKWGIIGDENDRALDEIDHDPKKQVNYVNCYNYYAIESQHLSLH